MNKAAVRIEELQDHQAGESSEALRSRVETCRRIQAERFRDLPLNANSDMSGKLLRAHCSIDAEQALVLRSAMEELALSARAYDRILKVARTIADLASSEKVETPHLLEAIQYRSLDRGLLS